MTNINGSSFVGEGKIYKDERGQLHAEIGNNFYSLTKSEENGEDTYNALPVNKDTGAASMDEWYIHIQKEIEENAYLISNTNDICELMDVHTLYEHIASSIEKKLKGTLSDSLSNILDSIINKILTPCLEKAFRLSKQI